MGKCPKCKAEIDPVQHRVKMDRNNISAEYACGTLKYHNGGCWQGDTCKDRQIEQLQELLGAPFSRRR